LTLINFDGIFTKYPCCPWLKRAVAQNQRKKRQCNQDHSSCVQTIPALSLFSPIGWKLLEIPCFHPVVDGDLTNDAENNDGNPEQRCDDQQDCRRSGPMPTETEKSQVQNQGCRHPERHDLTEQGCKDLYYRQKAFVICAHQYRVNKNSAAEFGA